MGDTPNSRIKPDTAGLFELSSTQLGHFTASQAEEFGFGSDLLSYHVKAGKFLRRHRGIYRFRDYPSSEFEDEMVAWLVAGRERSVVSHETALEMFDLSDVIPQRIHLTVPRTRRNLPRIPGVRIHTTKRKYHNSDVVNRNGFRVSSPTRSIVEVAESGLAPEQVEMAIRQALSRGLTTPELLREQASQRNARVRELIESGIASSFE